MSHFLSFLPSRQQTDRSKALDRIEIQLLQLLKLLAWFRKGRAKLAPIPEVDSSLHIGQWKLTGTFHSQNIGNNLNPIALPLEGMSDAVCLSFFYWTKLFIV